MGFIGESVHSGSVDPPVVEIEQGTDGDGVVDGFVVPSGSVERLHVVRRDAGRMQIHFRDETEEGLFVVGEGGCFEIAEYAPYELLASE
jgi:hypothetical protein